MRRQDAPARPPEVVERQTYLRGVNDRIANALPYDVGDDVVVLCECGRTDCSQWIRVAAALYQNVRRQPTLSIVLEGHEVPELDRVRQRRGPVSIVEPREDAGDEPLPPAA